MTKKTGQFEVHCLKCGHEFSTDKDPEATLVDDRPQCAKCKSNDTETVEKWEEEHKPFEDQKTRLAYLAELMESVDIPKGKRGLISKAFETTPAYQTPEGMYNFLCQAGVQASQASILTNMFFGGGPTNAGFKPPIIIGSMTQTPAFVGQYPPQNPPYQVGYAPQYQPPPYDPRYEDEKRRREELERRLQKIEDEKKEQSKGKIIIRRPPLVDEKGEFILDKQGNILRDWIEMPMQERSAADDLKESNAELVKKLDESFKDLKKAIEDKGGGIDDKLKEKEHKKELDEKMKELSKQHEERIKKLEDDKVSLEKKLVVSEHDKEKKDLEKNFEDRIGAAQKEFEGLIAELKGESIEKVKKDFETKLEDAKKAGLGTGTGTGGPSDAKAQRTEADAKLFKEIKDTVKEAIDTAADKLTPFMGRDQETNRFNQIVYLRTIEQQQGLKPGHLTDLLKPAVISDDKKKEVLERLKDTGGDKGGK